MNRLAISVVFAVGALFVPVVAHAQQSKCGDCHFAQNAPPNQDHLFDWDRSPHGRANVGCEKCHGGNATVFERSLAHRGVLSSGNKKSPTYRTNLPATCGACHVGPFVAFQDSRHYQLLTTGDNRGPTCSTCHDPVAGTLLSAKALEKQCSQCHGPREVAPRAERARNAREKYEGLATIRQELKLANSMIKRVDDARRRADLMAEYEQAMVPVTRAINAGHKFIYSELDENLNVAQERVEKLMARLANRAD